MWTKAHSQFVTNEGQEFTGLRLWRQTGEFLAAVLNSECLRPNEERAEWLCLAQPVFQHHGLFMRYKSALHATRVDQTFSSGCTVHQLIMTRWARPVYLHPSGGSFVLKTEGEGRVVWRGHSRGAGGHWGQRLMKVAVVMDAATTRNYLPAAIVCGQRGSWAGEVCC